MKNCIPDELFNTIEYPDFGLEDVDEAGNSCFEKIFQEIRYKIPSADDITVRKELWHTICDFCQRTGALVEKSTGSGGSAEISRPTDHGRFMWVVSCYIGDNYTTDFTVDNDLKHVRFFDTTSENAVIYSVRPEFSDITSDGTKWAPRIPEYFLTRYGECIMHGALMRLFVMTRQWGDAALARMHGVAYNNDLNRLSFGLITSGMRKHLLIDVEDWVVNATNGNG